MSGEYCSLAHQVSKGFGIDEGHETCQGNIALWPTRLVRGLG